jgi:hypothetical protein
MQHNKFPKLKLPEFEPLLELRDDTDFIWDPIRKKWLVCTPEEWVRQHFIHLLVHHLLYPKGLIKIESGLDYNQRKKRSDIEVLNKNGHCFMLIECKAANQKINQRSLNQISLYNKTVKAEYIVLTNGNQTFIWQLVDHQYEPLETFPQYPN